MTWQSGPMNDRMEVAHVVTVDELLEQGPRCGAPGPTYFRCMRGEHRVPPHAALGTDGKGVPVVMTWYRPTAFPVPSPEPGA